MAYKCQSHPQRQSWAPGDLEPSSFSGCASYSAAAVDKYTQGHGSSLPSTHLSQQLSWNCSLG